MRLGTAVSGLSSPNTIASFTYDAFGRRAIRQVNNQLTYYLYDGIDIVQELVNSTPITYLSGLNIDEPWVRNRNEFYLTDALGTILGLTDPAGVLTTRYRYEPFGQTSVEETPSPNPFQYTAREHDSPAGLYFYRGRYYSPILSRFISEDPIGLAGHQVNLYSYVFNNPTNFTDATGLVIDTLADVVSIGYDIYRLLADGRKGLGENFTALALDVGGFFVPGVTGLGTVSRGAQATRSAAKGATEIVQRAMSRAELQATQSTGLLRGGRQGTHYVSDAVNADPLRARQRLALPQTPEVRVTLEVPAGTFSPPTRVTPNYNMPGGGMERTATGAVPVRIIRVDPY